MHDPWGLETKANKCYKDKSCTALFMRADLNMKVILIVTVLFLAQKTCSQNVFQVDSFLSFIADEVKNDRLSTGNQRSPRLLSDSGKSTTLPSINRKCVSHFADYVLRLAVPFDNIIPGSGGNWPRKCE